MWAGWPTTPRCPPSNRLASHHAPHETPPPGGVSAFHESPDRRFPGAGRYLCPVGLQLPAAQVHRATGPAQRSGQRQPVPLHPPGGLPLHLRRRAVPDGQCSPVPMAAITAQRGRPGNTPAFHPAHGPRMAAGPGHRPFRFARTHPPDGWTGLHRRLRVGLPDAGLCGVDPDLGDDHGPTPARLDGRGRLPAGGARGGLARRSEPGSPAPGPRRVGPSPVRCSSPDRSCGSNVRASPATIPSGRPP